jgi:hypothetical protein
LPLDKTDEAREDKEDEEDEEEEEEEKEEKGSSNDATDAANGGLVATCRASCANSSCSNLCRRARNSTADS